MRVTGVMATLPDFKAGTRVVVEVTDEGLVVKPAARKKARFRFPYTENELLADLTPETVPADELAKLTAHECGD